MAAVPRLEPASTPAKRQMTRAERRQALEGYLFISPWFIGFVLLVAGPMAFAVYLSLCSWTGLAEVKFIGLDNFRLLLRDDSFWNSLRVTAYYTFLTVPLSLVLGLGLAMLLNQRIVALAWFRTAFYLPSITSTVAVAVIWWTLFNVDFGLVNTILGWFGIEPIPWLVSGKWVIPALVIMSLWGVGGSMVIYLAGLQGIPTELYEAAEIDGASGVAKFQAVTVPMLSPVILFNLIMGIIGSFQVFTNAWVMTRGGPGGASRFLVLYIYENAWQFMRMGYAAALSWVLFFIVLGFTLLVFRLTGRYVYYAGAQEGARRW